MNEIDLGESKIHQYYLKILQTKKGDINIVFT